MTEVAMQPSRIRSRSLLDVAIVTVAAIVAFCMADFYLRRLWAIGPDGLSALSKTLPYWDFSNLWAGGRMALDGHVGTLFDVDAYRAALRGMFGPDLPNQEWSYPPSILLIGAPLATLPI